MQQAFYCLGREINADAAKDDGGAAGHVEPPADAEPGDGGEIIAQKAVYIEPGDTPEILQRRVMEQAEWILLPQAAETVCAGLQK